MRLNAISIRTYATVLLVWLALSPVAAQTRGVQTGVRQAAATRPVIDLSRLRIDNFGEVNANYYRGGQPLGRDYQDLAALGIRTVIDLQKDGVNYDEERLVEKAGMKFYRIPMTTHTAPTADQLSSFLQIVNDPAQQPVYVHCAGGRHRTGVMTAVYRMEQDGWTPHQAFQEMKQYKFGMDLLHPEFKMFVYNYEPIRMARSAPSVTRHTTN